RAGPTAPRRRSPTKPERGGVRFRRGGFRGGGVLVVLGASPTTPASCGVWAQSDRHGAAAFERRRYGGADTKAWPGTEQGT
ncbi:MAG TPA: hypothetical protein VM580_11040, partial [Labilithrix sp.]|nr:hypothetical protein [Labilithrix sp.]